jgi:hypothetical protein
MKGGFFSKPGRAKWRFEMLHYVRRTFLAAGA